MRCEPRLGGAAHELRQLELAPHSYKNAKPRKEHPHLFPEPRIAQGRALRERGLATACIDLSDGLSTDLAHLCEASGVAAELDFELLPASSLLRAADAAIMQRAVLHGGEDYELLFTARPETRVPAHLLGIKVTAIGHVVRTRKRQPQILLDEHELLPGGWEHAL